MIRHRPIVYFVTVLCLCLFSFHSPAQDKAKHTFGKLLPEDFSLPNSPIIDSNTSAVILSDIGDVHFIGNKEGWFSHVYRRQTRIKILTKKAIGLATVSINLYGQKDRAVELLSNVEATAFNLENGQIQQIKLDQKDIFQNRVDKYWTEAKFSIPGVKEGSIIEYTYTITSSYDFDLPSWEFQSEHYPCLSSEYHVDIPQTLSYVLVRQGVHPYALDKGSTGHTSYRVTEKADMSAGLAASDKELIVSANTIKHDWVMKDIPAFGVEPFLTTPKNYIDKISFQLSGTYNGEETTNHMNTWAKATDELLANNQFAGALEEGNSKVDELASRIAVGGDQLAVAKAVYYYVSQHFTCTSYYDKYIRTSFDDVIRTNSGTVGDINLLLTALLRKAGFEADPVLLSTREYGFNMVSYPILDKLNYVITRVKIDRKTYYLDAAHPQLGFGALAANCYNGHARVISKADSGPVYFEADSLRETKLTMVLLTPTDSGLAGNWQSTLGNQESYEVRRKVGERGVRQFFKDIQTAYGEDLQIGQSGIDSLNLLEEPVKVYYDFMIKQPVGGSIIYFNPVIGDGWRENPFSAAERKYPVEMNYARDETYIFSMQIPDGYVVDELPRSTRVVFNGDQGSFEYLIVSQADQIQLRCKLRLNKAWFTADDYGALRDFFAAVVKKESEQIVLKKK